MLYKYCHLNDTHSINSELYGGCMPDIETSHTEMLPDIAHKSVDSLYASIQNDDEREDLVEHLALMTHALSQTLQELIIKILDAKQYTFLEDFLVHAKLRAFIRDSFFSSGKSIQETLDLKGSLKNVCRMDMTLYWIALRDYNKKLMNLVYKFNLIPQKITAECFYPEKRNVEYDHYEAANAFSTEGDVAMFRLMLLHGHIPFSLTALQRSLMLSKNTSKKLEKMDAKVRCWQEAVTNNGPFEHCDLRYINTQPKPEESPLHRALREMRGANYVQQLLNAGADPNIRDTDGNVASLWAFAYHSDILRLFRQYGATFLGLGNDYLGLVSTLLTVIHNQGTGNKLPAERFDLLLSYVKDELAEKGIELNKMLAGRYLIQYCQIYIPHLHPIMLRYAAPEPTQLHTEGTHSAIEINETFYDSIAPYFNYIFSALVIIITLLVYWRKYVHAKQLSDELIYRLNEIGVKSDIHYEFSFFAISPLCSIKLSMHDYDSPYNPIISYFIIKFFKTIGLVIPADYDELYFANIPRRIIEKLSEAIPDLTIQIENEISESIYIQEQFSRLTPRDFLDTRLVDISSDQLRCVCIPKEQLILTFHRNGIEYSIDRNTLIQHILDSYKEMGMLVDETDCEIVIDISMLYAVNPEDLKKRRKQLQERVFLAASPKHHEVLLSYLPLDPLFTDDVNILKKIKEVRERYDDPLGAKNSAERLIRIHGIASLGKLKDIPDLRLFDCDLKHLKQQRAEIENDIINNKPFNDVNEAVALFNSKNTTLKKRLDDIAKWLKMMQDQKCELEEKARGVYTRPIREAVSPATSRTSKPSKTSPKSVREKMVQSPLQKTCEPAVTEPEPSAAADAAPASSIELLVCPPPTEAEMQEYVDLTNWRNTVEDLDVNEDVFESRMALGYLILYHLRLLENIQFHNPKTQKGIKIWSNAIRHSIYNMIRHGEFNSQMHKELRSICDYLVSVLKRYENNRVRVTYVLDLDLEQFKLITVSHSHVFSDYRSLEDFPSCQKLFAVEMKQQLLDQIRTISKLFSTKQVPKLILASKMSLLHCGDILKMILIKYLQLTTERKETELKAYEGDNEAFQAAKSMICSDFGIPAKTSNFFYEILVPLANNLAHPKKDDLSCTQLTVEQRRALERLATLNLDNFQLKSSPRILRATTALFKPPPPTKEQGTDQQHTTAHYS